MATIGLGGIIYAMIESSRRTWDNAEVMGSLLLGVSALAAFFIIEVRSSAPLLPLRVFLERSFAGTNLLTLFLYAALSGMLFFFPMNLIQVQGYSATAAGAAMLPLILLIFLLSRWSGGLVDRYGARLPLIAGPIVAAAGFALFAAPGIGGSYWATFFPAVVVLGLGMAITVAPLTTVVMNSISEEHAGIASGINNAVSRVAAVLAVAVLGIVMLGSFNRQLDDRLMKLNLRVEVRQQLKDQQIRLAEIDIPAEIEGAEREAVQQSIDESFVYGFRFVVWIAAGLALGSAATAWLVLQDKSSPTRQGVS